MSDIAALARGVILTGLTEPPKPQWAGFAGYLMFSRNGTSAPELRAFTDAIRERYDDRSLIAIDQEGGRVARLERDVETIPSMMALGAAGDAELARRAGEQTAFDLRRAGCTLDFAPVLDLALDPANTVIGTRSFGSNPQRVAALGAAFAGGLTSGGILPCYKHFPGHGATAVDSHDARPCLDVDEATLRGRDVAPFAAIARDAAAIMGAHVVVACLDRERPATLSPRIATELLRSELGFRGVLVTDCLEMKAIAPASPVDALNAGSDLLIFSHSVDLALAAAADIEAAVARGRLPLARLEEAHARVARLREAAKPPLPLDAFPPHPNIGREIARRAITVLRGVPEASPLTSCAVSFGSETASLKREAPALAELTLSRDPGAAELERAFASLAQSDRRPILLARRAHLHASQAEAIDALVARYPDALAVSLLEPYDLPLFAGARHLLAAYGDDAASIGGLADVLFGNSMPSGKLPVELKV
ncbi:MAG TPA: glycoside hydrolase family 3 N-terminal domain-containing protein [Candidatus Cybelea sp.]